MLKPTPTSLHVTTIQGQNETIDTFERASINKNKIPSKEIVEKLFEKLLSIRAFPEKAKISLRNLSTERKWDLLLTENETNSFFDLSRMSLASMSAVSLPENVRSTHSKTPDLSSHAKPDSAPMPSKRRRSFFLPKEPQQHRETMINEGSPGWFVWKLLNKDIDLKSLVKLEKHLAENKLLQQEKVTWTQSFLSLQGETALAVNLSLISKKVIKSDEEYNHEYLLVKCLKNALENQAYLKQSNNDHDTPISKSVIMTSLMGALTSTRMSTRFLVTEILVNLMKNGHKELRMNIVNHLRDLSFSNKKTSHFRAWLEVFGSSLRTASWGSKVSDHSYLKNYITITLILINVIVNTTGPARKRIVIRKELEESHLLSVFETIKQFEDDRIHQELEKYERLAREDEEEKIMRHSKTLPTLPTPQTILNHDDETDSQSVLASSLVVSDDLEELSRYGLFGSQKKKSREIDLRDQSQPETSGSSFPRNNESLLAQQVYLKIAKLESSLNSSGLKNKVLLLLDSLIETGPHLQLLFNEKDSFSAGTVERLIDSLASESIARNAIAETKTLKRELKRQKQLNESLAKNAELQNKSKLATDNESHLQEIKSLGRQISLLQRQIKQLEQDKAKNFRNRNINHSFEDLSNREETDDDVEINNQIEALVDFHGTNLETSKKAFRGPPTPPLLYSRPNIPVQEKDDNSISESASQEGDKAVEQAKCNESPTAALSQALPVIAPPPPPVPTFLEDLGKSTRAAIATRSVNVPLAPPLPPFMVDLKLEGKDKTLASSKPEETAGVRMQVAEPIAPPPPPPPPPPPVSYTHLTLPTMCQV